MSCHSCGQPGVGDGLLSPVLRDLLGGGFSVRLRVTGRSMMPRFVDDDVVTIAPVDPASVRIGDVVYTEGLGQPPRLHRVVAKARTADGSLVFRTKGDALLGPDPPVGSSCVRGKAVLVLRGDRPDGPRERGLADGACHQFALALASRFAPRILAAFSRSPSSNG